MSSNQHSGRLSRYPVLPGILFYNSFYFTFIHLVGRLRPTPNPLARHCQKQLEAYPDWRSLYADPRLPFHLDLGCGKGHLVYHLACEHPEMNFLGLELQEERVKPFPALPNLAYVCCNVNVSLEPLLKSYASQLADHHHQQQHDSAVATTTAMTVKRVSILYPDPWFKKRHAKRRMVTPELVRTIHGFLDDGPDSEVYLETDFGEGFFEAKDIFLRDSFVLETDEKRFPACRFGMSGSCCSSPLPSFSWEMRSASSSSIADGFLCLSFLLQSLRCGFGRIPPSGSSRPPSERCLATLRRARRQPHHHPTPTRFHQPEYKRYITRHIRPQPDPSTYSPGSGC